MEKTSSRSSGGISFMGLLAIVFITLKLTGYIAWSWWLVLAPLWAPFSLIIAALLIALAIYVALKMTRNRGR